MIAWSYLISVVHPHPTAPWVKVIHLPFILFASISWGENDPELSWLVNDKISCSVLRSNNIRSDGWWDCSSVLTLKDYSKQALVFLTWSPKACLPIVKCWVHPGMRRGMFLQRIGSRKTVPPKIFLMVPFGLFHIFFSLNYASQYKSYVWKENIWIHLRWGWW